MGYFGAIGKLSMDAASVTSLTSALAVDGQFDEFALQIPSGIWASTATANIRMLGSNSATGTYYQIQYSNSPATTTSVAKFWEVSMSTVVNGGIVKIDTVVPAYVKLQFTATATITTDFILLGRVS